MACRMSVRLIFLMIGSSLMTLTTTPNQLTDALESLLGPLKKIHVPVHEISMMMSIALRFIPILLEETDKIEGDQIWLTIHLTMRPRVSVSGFTISGFSVSGEAVSGWDISGWGCS